jgi:hemerythrin-like domain-containing protein
MRAFAERLQDHVRFEERTLFPACEALLSGEQLARLRGGS